jgi:hypothetical protein
VYLFGAIIADIKVFQICHTRKLHERNSTILIEHQQEEHTQKMTAKLTAAHLQKYKTQQMSADNHYDCKNDKFIS